MKNDNKIQISTAAYSDVGKVRKSNEDSFFVSKDENLLIVCDGMGGQVAGGLASKIAVETIKDIFYGISEEVVNKIFADIDTSLTLTSRLLIAGVRIANRRLHNMTIKFPKLQGMGTTVVAITFDKAVATMVHVGDSRILRFSEGKVLQLTEDHSWLNELIEDNEINEEEIETFTQKNVITRALGTSPAVKIDIHCEKYKKNDIYILCTDGLHNSVKNNDLKLMFSKNNEPIDILTKQLIEKAKTKDGSDNITAAVAQIKQSSVDSNISGISSTISAEDEKIIAREDKFIHEKYEDTKHKLMNMSQMNNTIQQKLITGGVILITAMFCFFLGLNFNSNKQNMNNKRAQSQNAIKNTTKNNSNNSTEIPENHVPKRINQQNQVLNQIPPIQRSKLNKNAVLAFVFFNSQQDYKKAMLEERSHVLDKMFPYSNNAQYNKFSIFLIDSTNNVIWKTAGIKLPEF